MKAQEQLLISLYKAQFLPYKNPGRMHAAYKQIIGSRGFIGLELEFLCATEIARAIAHFLDKIPQEELSVVQLGYDNEHSAWTNRRHSVAENDSTVCRELRLKFDVSKPRWTKYLKSILDMLISQGTIVGSIHVHYNLLNSTNNKGLKGDRRTNNMRSIIPKRMTNAKINIIASKLYGGYKSDQGNARRYRADNKTPTFEIRLITPTLYFPQLLMEILWWEQTVKEITDSYLRSNKKKTILEAYVQIADPVCEIALCNPNCFHASWRPDTSQPLPEKDRRTTAMEIAQSTVEAIVGEILSVYRNPITVNEMSSSVFSTELIQQRIEDHWRCAGCNSWTSPRLRCEVDEQPVCDMCYVALGSCEATVLESLPEAIEEDW